MRNQDAMESLVEIREEPRLWPGARSLAVAAVVYLLALVAATWPFALRFGRGLPANWVDVYQHLWVMRWYRACLLEGRWPLFCDEVQWPVGAPLGLFSPLQLPSLVFVPLSFVIDNDILCYNLVWTLSLLATGLGVNLLSGWVVGDRSAALVAGLLAMLSAPVMIQAHSAVELTQLGGLALFLWSWLRFVDAPGWRRLWVAVGLYGVVALGAAYFAVFVTFPAALYVVWRGIEAWRRGDRRWSSARAGWFAMFGVLAVLVAGLALFNQIWARWQGFPMVRMRSQFAAFRAPGWSYVVPTPLNALGQLLPVWVSGEGDPLGPIGWSYLGVWTVVLGLLAVVSRVRFPRAGFWWGSLVLVVVLSAGDSWTLAGWTIPMPAGWLRDHTPLFASIRVPARFNLLAVVIAAVLASAGLSWLLRLDVLRRRPASRWFLVGLLLVLATADGAMVPFEEEPRPAMPGSYAFLRRHDPDAVWVEAPQFNTEGATHLAAATLYWQSLHRGRTTAGYSGQGNARADNLLVRGSPFSAYRLRRPEYLRDPETNHYDLTPNVRFADQAWLYLHVHKLDYVVMHLWPGVTSEFKVDLDRIRSLLAPARIYGDGVSEVYDARLLEPPQRATVLCKEGWRPHQGLHGRDTRSVGQVARVAVYNPDASRPVQLGLDLAAFRRDRVVRLLDADGAELCRWAVAPREFQSCVSPALRLPEGVSELSVVSDGEDVPRRARESAREGDDSAYSLIGARVEILPAPAGAAPVIAAGGRADSRGAKSVPR